MSNRKRRRQPTKGRGVVAGSSGGPTGAPLSPDELVFGNAAQLREMAEALRRGAPTARAQAAAARGRVATYVDRHPGADLHQLHGRPICETAVAEVPRPPRPPVRVVTNTVGAAELWVDDYIEPPSPWGDYGVSARSIREALDEVGSRDVVVHMNSGGGDYFEGVAIYQALSQHPGDVYVAVDALAASAASVVAMAGDTIGIGPGAFVMIHEASAFAYGNADDLLRIADMLDAIGDEISGFYATRGKLDAPAFREAMAKETWYGPAAAIAAGLADEHLAVPATDPNAVDPDEDEDDDEDEMDPAVAALFDFGRPTATTTAPPPPAEVPDTTDHVDWGALFRDDTLELFAP